MRPCAAASSAPGSVVSYAETAFPENGNMGIHKKVLHFFQH